MGLYTDTELVEKIKEIDTQLSTGVSKTSLDTTQTKSEVSISVRTLREQRDYWLVLLQQQNNSLYQSIMGKSVIKFKGRFRGQC